MAKTSEGLASRFHDPVESSPPVESGQSDIERDGKSGDGGGAAAVFARSGDYRIGSDGCPVVSAAVAIAGTGGGGSDCGIFAVAVVVAVGITDIAAAAVVEIGNFAKPDDDPADPGTCLADAETAVADNPPWRWKKKKREKRMVQCRNIDEPVQKVGSLTIDSATAIEAMPRVGADHGEEQRGRSSSLPHSRFWEPSGGSGPEGCLSRWSLLGVE